MHFLNLNNINIIYQNSSNRCQPLSPPPLLEKNSSSLNGLPSVENRKTLNTFFIDSP